MVPPSPFLQCSRALTPGASGILAHPAEIDAEFRKAWLPYFCRSGQRETSLDEFNGESVGWLPHLDEFFLPALTGDMLFEVVERKSASAGSLDGWGWRELKVLPVAWFDGLARILTRVEELGVWPDGLLDAYITMIPKVDGDATPLGQRPLTVLPVVYRIWASARIVHLEPWFSVFSAGGGRSSVQAWFTTALDIEEVLSGIVGGDVHIFVADVIKSFDTVDRGILDRVLSSLGLPGWFRHVYFEFHSLVRLRFKLAAGLGQAWTGQVLADVVQRKGVTAGILDGWGWRELKVLPVSWYDGLARILTKVEKIGVWPHGLLDAYIAMIPKTDGGAAPLGQRPLSVVPIVYRIWASARMGQLEDWF